MSYPIKSITSVPDVGEYIFRRTADVDGERTGPDVGEYIFRRTADADGERTGDRSGDRSLCMMMLFYSSFYLKIIKSCESSLEIFGVIFSENLKKDFYLPCKF